MGVKIYTTPTCHYCKTAKEFLTKKNIPFEEVDVAADENAAKEMIEKSGQMGVPVIMVSENGGKPEIIIGFDKDKLINALGIEE